MNEFIASVFSTIAVRVCGTAAYVKNFGFKRFDAYESVCVPKDPRIFYRLV